MANPTAVNIGIGFDTKELAKGVELARGQVRSFMRDVKATITDTERFAQKVDIGKSLLARGDINQAEFNRVIAMYRQKYGIIDEGEKRLAEYNAHKQAIAAREEESMIFMHNLRKTGMQMEQEAHAKRLADIAAEKKAEEDSMVFLNLLNKTRITMEQEAHAKRLADIAAEKKAEEAEMIFRHELLKQIRLDEEQRHSQKMANIAAEKKFSETLGVGAYGSAKSAMPATDLSKPLIDPVTGAVLKQKEVVDALGVSASKVASSTSKTKTDYASINFATGEMLQNSQSVLSTEYKRNQALQVYLKLVREALNENKKLAASQNESVKKNIGGGLGFLGRNLGQFGTGVMAGFGVAGISSAASQAGQALGNFIADSVKLAMERQRISAAMEAMLGSEEAAQKLTKAMIQLDRQSMLTYSTISKGAQTLLGFGVTQEMVMPSLQALSKISLGNAERFQSLSLAFGQVAASGKLAGQEILQMVNAGFNPLQEIARVTGTTVAQLKADVEAGRVSFLQVAEAILTATEAGGRFEKISEKMLQTPAGMLAKLQSDFELIKADLGERLMPSMVAMFESIKDNEFVIESLATNIANLFDTFGFVLALVQDYKNLMTIGDTGDPVKNFKKSGDFILQWEKRQEEMQKRRAEQKAQRDKKQAEEEAFGRLTPEERKRRLAQEQAKMDEFRTDQQRAKSRAEMQKKIQDLEDKTDRARYFREIGGHLARLPEQIKLINDAMAEFDRESELRLIEERAKNIQDEINSMREESNKLGMREIDILIQKYGLNKRHLTLEEKRQKNALIAEQKQLDASRALERARALSPKDDVIQKVADIMLALDRGFINAEEAQRMQIDAAKDLAKENEVSLENPKMMDFGRALIESQKAGKVQQTQEVMKQKLIEIAGHAKQQVDELKKIPGFAERN